MLVKLDGKDYYLVYEKSKIQDWTLLGLVPTDIVNTSMNTLQFTTMLLGGGSDALRYAVYHWTYPQKEQCKPEEKGYRNPVSG